MVNKIEYIKSIEIENKIYIDTRAPVEFNQDHIPDAVNIPIFNNEERALVGTMYKQVSPDLAIEKGHEIYRKKIEDIKKELKKFKDNKLIIYCWRGGMRSKAITELAEGEGLKCYQLNRGYKSYRKYVRTNLEKYQFKPKLIVLHGLTGCGKTDLLQYFKDKIDLEGLAQHRSSVFGMIGLSPRTQKAFESLLLKELIRLNDKEHIIIEGESRKIGNLIMPDFLYKAMKHGINIKVESSFESRINRLVSIYTNNETDINRTKEITKTLEKKLGKKAVFQLITFLKNNDINNFMKMILEKYYDPLYKYSIEKLEYDLIVDSDDISEAEKRIKNKYKIK